MFNSLSGTITQKLPKQLLLETNGIEWDITVPDTCLNNFPPVGNQGKVYTYLNHYENGMDLYGFSSQEERSLFFDLLKVDGVGPKAAVKIMSSVSLKDLVSILDREDLSGLEKIPGIGKKTAAKMLLSLKGKLTIPDSAAPLIRKKEYEVVTASLIEMGYERQQIEKAISDVLPSLQQESSFNSAPQSEKENTVFRKVLMEIAR
ncbi:MAG: Holliday junction branch migration protein RuvA [Treponema sp.]|nr:Holliday junction branch migration protein RuvA [Treponema sp.]